MILVNRPWPDPMPDKTIIYLSCNNIDIIVKTPEKNPVKLAEDVQKFIDQELAKAENQLSKYTTIVKALKEMGGY